LAINHITHTYEKNILYVLLASVAQVQPPRPIKTTGQKPAIAIFHGGGWFKGTPK